MAWELMREEAGQGTAYLGEELGKHLGAEAAGDGQGSCTGGMRKAVTGKQEDVKCILVDQVISSSSLVLPLVLAPLC